jgi:phosphodiesterase/alkaline phosphatase D-like protein
MMLVTYPRAAPPGTVRVWIGLFGVPNPAQPTMTTSTGQGAASTPLPLAPIRDAVSDAAGQALNHRTVLQIDGLEPCSSHRVVVSAGGEQRELTLTSLPTALPQKMQGEFNILLCSCYSQPEDASGLLGTVVSQIMLRPAMTMMLGDQIYGDLPLFEDLPDQQPDIARKLGQKYFRNWASPALDSGGLGRVLSRAPFLCVADDHEYWNNYPHRQAQLPLTWTDDGQVAWEGAARGLYEDYQALGPAGGAQRIDIAPLRMLVLDARSRRDKDFDALLTPAAVAALASWEDELSAERAAGRPAVGLLVSGQALFAPPTDEARRKRSDAEMSNYSQFDLVVRTLERLSAAGGR